MASIRKRKKKDGSIAYYADIVIKRKGKIEHREGRSFTKLALAKAWAAKRELELQEQDVYGEKKQVVISDLINAYLERFSAGRSKRYDLLRLANSDLAEIDAYKLTVQDIVKHCMERNKTAKPQTVKNDVVWLKTVMDTMKAVGGHDYSTDMIATASKMLNKEGITGRSDERDRRPSKEELRRLSRHLYHLGTSIPHLHIMWFAIYSARRLSEICKIEWADINHDNRTIMVRDLKTPGKRVLNLRAKLPKSAYKIIMRQPKTDKFIFPYKSKTISTTFARCCKILNIEGLHFHDLRRHSISNMSDAGYNIEQIAQVSLHLSWASLKVYHKPDPGDLDI